MHGHAFDNSGLPSVFMPWYTIYFIIYLMCTRIVHGIVMYTSNNGEAYPMFTSRQGSGLIMLILAVLVISIGSIMASKSFLAPGTDNGPTPIERSWDAVCAANKALISQQLQIYAINNGPMNELDLQRLFSGSFKLPDKCPCSYSLNSTGQVVCKTHH